MLDHIKGKRMGEESQREGQGDGKGYGVDAETCKRKR